MVFAHKTQITSDVPTGTAPISVASTTECPNLNAARLQGNAASAFAAASHTHTASQITDFLTEVLALSYSKTATDLLLDAHATEAYDGATDFASRGVCDGRLTTESGVAVSTTNRQAQSTLYLTPYNGNKLGLFNGSTWDEYKFSETSLALSGLTSGTVYDVFAYYDGGAPALSLTAWSSATARATALVLQDGVYVKSGATGYLYLGTICATSSTTTEDSFGVGNSYGGKRYVYNHFNRVPRRCFITYTTSHTQTAGTGTRQWNADPIAQIDMVLGHDQFIQFNLQGIIGSSAGPSIPVALTGLGIDSTTATNLTTYTPTLQEYSASASRCQPITAGKHFVSMNQRTTVANATYLAGVLDSIIWM